MKTIYLILVFFGLIVLAVGLIVGIFYAKRNINYSLMYKSMVIETIKETVKESCIKEK
uniref:Uncharacterized protein n=1 Tax=viral metagenome TaxID=1070528 RepID=A0A6M3J0J1_9ZZZZ